jgi:hypothetical protein
LETFSLPEEETEAIIRRARFEGHTISSRQLSEWGRKGLLPPSRSPGLGRGKGRQTAVYPFGTARQAIECSKLFGQNLSAAEVGWELWVQGYSVGEEYWKPHFEKANQLLKNLGEALIVDDEDGIFSFSDDLEEAFKKVIQQGGNPTWTNRMVQRVGHEDAVEFLAFVLNAAAGNLDYQTKSDDDLERTSRALGIQSASKKRRVEPLPFVEDFQSSILENFGMLSSQFTKIWSPDFLIAQKEASLRDATCELYILYNYFNAIGDNMKERHPYFILLRQIFSQLDFAGFAAFALVWLAIRDIPEWRWGMMELKARFFPPI